MKLITMADARVGDTVEAMSGLPVLVESAEEDDGVIRLVGTWGEEEQYYADIEAAANAWIALLHRPRLEGKTEEDMLNAVDVALRRCAHASIENDGRSIGAYVELTPYTAGREEALRSLREAIEAYELGKPEEPKRNESLVDRHMTP